MVLQFLLNGPSDKPVPLLARTTQYVATPYDLLAVLTTPPSSDVAEVMQSEGVQMLARVMSRIRENLPASQILRAAVVFLRSIPGGPCDSDNPESTANVADNIKDLRDHLMSPRTVLMPAGQAAMNVLTQYNLPVVLGHDDQCLPNLPGMDDFFQHI